MAKQANLAEFEFLEACFYGLYSQFTRGTAVSPVLDLTCQRGVKKTVRLESKEYSLSEDLETNTIII